jgi:antitoxin component of MazEF toxin-antitoxin module
MENVIAHRIIRRIHTSLNVCLPASYARENHLNPGDHVVLIAEGSELRLRFVRTGSTRSDQAEEVA